MFYKIIGSSKVSRSDVKGSLRNYYRMEDSNETQQSSAVWIQQLDPGTKQEGGERVINVK
jgi:hypothetical protein